MIRQFQRLGYLNYPCQLIYLNHLKYGFASKRIIVDLKKFREAAQPSNLQNESQSDVINKERLKQSSSKVSKEMSAQVKESMINNKSTSKVIDKQKQQMENLSGSQKQTQQPLSSQGTSTKISNSKEIRSRQLSCEIMRCSQERELWQLYPKCHETQHLVMVFYSMLRLRKFKMIFNIHKQKLNGDNTNIKEEINNQNSLWDNKKFIDLAERIRDNLDDMNPDSLNLILRAIRLKKFAGGFSTLPSELFVNIFSLLARDKNILLFNEMQLFHFLKNLSDMKTTLTKYGDIKNNSKVVQLAMNKLAPNLMQFRRTQLLAMTIVSLNLELFDSSFHLKLNQAVLRRFVYLTSTDFTLLFQYNTLHYLQFNNKKFNADKENEKNDILNRVIAYMEKGDIWSKTHIKNLLKFCAFFYQLDFHPKIEANIQEKLSNLIPQKLSELVIAAQQLKNIPSRDAPTQLRDAFGYLLKNPQIFIGKDQGSQFFHSLRAFVALENIGYDNLMHISHFLIECILKAEEKSIQILDFHLDQQNILIKTLEMAIQKINVQFNLTKPDNLEEIFELLYKLEDNLKVKYILSDGAQEDLNKILLKATKYVCQVTHKLGASVIIKIGIQLRELLSESVATEQRFKKYLQRYALSEVFTKYEEALRFAEIKEKFNDQQIKESSLEDPGIDQLEFSQDIQKIEEQLRERVKAKKEKISSTSSHFINALELPSLAMIDKYPKYLEFQEVVKRQTHCVNALLLSQLAFSDSSFKLQEQDIFEASIQLLQKQFIGQLLTIDNINNLMMISQLFCVNGTELFKLCPEIAELADKRVETLKQYFQTRKKQTKDSALEFFTKIKLEQIESIEECVDFHHCLVDLVIHTNSKKKIAIIAAAKAFDIAELGRGFDSKENKLGYITNIRLQFLRASGFDEAYAVDNKNFNIFLDYLN